LNRSRGADRLQRPNFGGRPVSVSIPPATDIGFLYADLSACFLALANALEAKGVLTKCELATSAQERLLALQGRRSTVDANKLLLLQSLATLLEGRPPD
jgi:hypothetical protein